MLASCNAVPRFALSRGAHCMPDPSGPCVSACRLTIPTTLRPAGTQTQRTKSGPGPSHTTPTRLFVEAVPISAPTYHSNPTPGVLRVPLTPHRYLLFVSRLASREEQQALLAQLQMAWEGLQQVAGQLTAQEGANQVGW